MKQCPRCNTYSEDNNRYCSKCGAPLDHVPYQQQYSDDAFAPSGPEGKSRGVAALLAILVGSLGIHYFYCNKIKGGLICLGLGLISCELWSTVCLVQGILFFTWTNQQFEEKFVNNESIFPLF